MQRQHQGEFQSARMAVLFRQDFAIQLFRLCELISPVLQHRQAPGQGHRRLMLVECCAKDSFGMGKVSGWLS